MENEIFKIEKRELIDPDTGEIKNVDHVIKKVSSTRNFWKCYLMDFLCVLGIVDSKQIDVFIYIVENTDPSNNTFLGSHSKIGAGTGISKSTIVRTMKKLQENNFIRKVQHGGVWQVNPNVLMKGNDRKRHILLSYFNEEKSKLPNKTIKEEDLFNDFGEVKEKD